MKTEDRKWEAERKLYRRYVATLSEDEAENERYTVRNEWNFAESDYHRRYPHLERDDFLALLGVWAPG